MEKQNFINKRIEIEEIEKIVKLLRNKQVKLNDKHRKSQEEMQYSESKVQRYKLSSCSINIEIRYIDGLSVEKENEYDWFITEIYSNREKIEKIRIIFSAYIKEYDEIGNENIRRIERYMIWIGENDISFLAKSENYDEIVYETINDIKNIIMGCPDKYDKTIKGKFLRSQSLYLAIGFLVTIILILITKFYLMPKYDAIAIALNNKLVYIFVFLILVEFLGSLIGNTIINSLYQRITPKQKRVFNRKTHNTTYTDDIERYKSDCEIMIGKNTYNTSDRIKIEKMFSICKKIIIIELCISVIVGIVFFYV